VEQLEQELVELRQDRNPTAEVLNPNREQQRQARLDAALDELEEARAAVGAAREDLRALQREARRAGALPGWLR
jgi:hypothetical protein